jgi:hypothetical protein
MQLSPSLPPILDDGNTLLACTRIRKEIVVVPQIFFGPILILDGVDGQSYPCELMTSIVTTYAQQIESRF